MRMTYWYLSFVDTTVSDTIPLDQQIPGGKSWLGACIVEVPEGGTVVDAARIARDNGCNPGGEVAGWALVPVHMARIVTNTLATTPAEADDLFSTL